MPIRTRTPTLLACLLLAACGSSEGGRPAITRVERFGDLELVTHVRSERGGDASGFAPIDVSHWSLRWRGEPVRLDSLGGMFGDRPQQVETVHAVFLLHAADAAGAAVPPDAASAANPPHAAVASSAADLLVLVGDPNNTGAYHRVRVRDGALQAPIVCITSGGSNGVQALAQLPEPGAGHDIGMRTVDSEPTRWLQGPRREQLATGGVAHARRLRLGNRCVLDVDADRVSVVPHDPDHLHSIDSWGPALLSPDSAQLLRLGLRGEQSVVAAVRLQSLPEGIIAGSVEAWQFLRANPAAWQVLPIDRRRMRMPRLESVDAAWLAHHFAWMPTGDGGWTLAERSGFEPLPPRGWYLENHHQYSLDGLADGASADLARHVAALLGARLHDVPAHYGPGLQLELDGIRVDVSPEGFFIAVPHDAPAGHPVRDPARRDALIRRIGDAVDAELARGALDHLFAGPTSTPAAEPGSAGTRRRFQGDPGHAPLGQPIPSRARHARQPVPVAQARHGAADAGLARPTRTR